VRRETISAYLRGAGVEIWPPGRWRRERKAKAAIEVITGSDAAKPAIPGFADPLNPNAKPNPENLSTKGRSTTTSKPAIAVITDFGVGLSGKEPENSKGACSASSCEPYREIIELGLNSFRYSMYAVSYKPAHRPERSTYHARACSFEEAVDTVLRCPTPNVLSYAALPLRSDAGNH
jgi:hypothetical protein